MFPVPAPLITAVFGAVNNLPGEAWSDTFPVPKTAVLSLSGVYEIMLLSRPLGVAPVVVNERSGEFLVHPAMFVTEVTIKKNVLPDGNPVIVYILGNNGNNPLLFGYGPPIVVPHDTIQPVMGVPGLGKVFHWIWARLSVVGVDRT